MVAPGAKKPSSSRLDVAAQEALRAHYEALAQVEEQFRDFDVVWAKVHGFPWWPGVLFSSWNVVQRAGIRTDPKIVSELVVPPPEKVPELDAATGQETGRFRFRRHCLVMFLDKFNFSVVEIDPSNVASFTAHFQLYQRAVMGSKNKKKTEFKRALVKAAELLHLGKKFVDDDLVMLEEPSPAEKKQRMEEVMGVADEDSASLDDAWDDPEKGDESALSTEDVGGEGTAAEEKQLAKPQKKSSKKSARKGKAAEAKDPSDVEDEDVVILTPVKHGRKAPAKDAKPKARKASRKESGSAAHVVSPSPSPIDLTSTLESEIKKSRKSAKASAKPHRPKKKNRDGEAVANGAKGRKNGGVNVLIVDDEDEDELPMMQSMDVDGGSNQIPNEVADITHDRGPSNLVLTPLSPIWTTTISDNQSAEAGAHSQLAYKQDFVWDDAVFTDDLSIAEKEKAETERKQAEDAAAHAGFGRERSLGKRQSRSVQQSQIRQNLMTGNLDPHTMVQCAAYRPNDYVEDPNSRSRGGPTLDPPFQLVVHPDAVFVADLHSHLATCEIIGFLGGKWNEASKILYIQAAFPCRSLVIDGDDGSTDVEMDPESEIELRGIIENAQLEVVGWYHSHPAFAPDPSVRDIENQTSYQQLFQRPSTSKEANGERKPSEPFVGLIVGTYDTRRSTPVSLFRYFHTRGEKVTGGARREIYMPYEFIPGRRHFRSVLLNEKRERSRLYPMYHSVLQLFNLELASVKHQVPVDIKLAPTRKAKAKSSPARARTQGSIRKRKQSSENAGNMPVKKAKAKSRRSARSNLASHIELTGENDGQNPESAKNSAPKGDHESTMNVSTAEAIMIEATSSDALAAHDENAEVLTSSKCVDSHVGSSKVAGEMAEVEPQVAEVVADVVISAEVANSGGEKRKRSRKAQHPKRISENSSSSGADDQLELITTVECDPAAKPVTKVPSIEVAQCNEAESSKTAVEPVVENGVSSIDALVTTSTEQPSTSSSPAARVGVFPSTSNGSNRKRDRKPRKTVKNSNRSSSPASDGPSPRRPPSPTNPSAQTLYEAFQALGPRVHNGGTHEDNTRPASRAESPKPDIPLEDEVKYIFVDENMGMGATSNDRESKACKTPAADKCGPVVTEEVRSFVTCLVDQVVERVAQTTVAGSKLNSHNGKADPPLVAMISSSSTVEPAISGELKNSALKRDSTVVDAAEKSICKSGKQRSTGPQLFGSNCECEDIQTSLQKMAVHVDKLKTLWATRPSESKAGADSTPDTESKLVDVQPVVEHDQATGEQDYLTALRTKYGAGVGGCTEQVITLVDYYRDFERRTDLNEIWKSQTTKLEKIESSLSEYVQFLNIPPALRHDFVKDLISYLRESWATKDRRR